MISKKALKLGLLLGSISKWPPPTFALLLRRQPCSRGGCSKRCLHSTISSLQMAALSTHNRLLDLSFLQNDFCALRHGQSTANTAKIISSHPEIATEKHGLSNEGRLQAKKAGTDVVEYYKQRDYSGIVILSSDYRRARETANFVCDAIMMNGLPLYQEQVIIEKRLRERWFGDFDGKSDEHYVDVWRDDETDSSHKNNSVESVNSVTDRTTKAVLEWDRRFQNHLILLVAHGDVLQITQTAFSKLNGSRHRSLEHLETATLRKLELASKRSDAG